MEEVKKYEVFTSTIICITMKYRFDVNEFKKQVANSKSMGHLLELLGVIKAGGNYATMKHRIRELNIDISHWKITRKSRQAWQLGKQGTTHIPLSDILVENSTYKGGTFLLKSRLLKERLFDHKCYRCNLSTWMSNPIPLELEHKNGNRFDNRMENLTLLCPNCHALTSTYRGKNKKVGATGPIRTGKG